MSSEKDPCDECRLDWGCLGCKNKKKETTFSEEYMKLLSELFGDD